MNRLLVVFPKAEGEGDVALVFDNFIVPVVYRLWRAPVTSLRLGRVYFGLVLFWIATSVSLSGCGYGRTVTVSGTASFDGQPIEQGKISFRSAGKNEPPQFGDIKGGKYKCNVTIGKQTVEIDALRAIAGAESTGIGQENYIPEKYNSKSELTAAVTGAGPNEFNFDLHSR